MRMDGNLKSELTSVHKQKRDLYVSDLIKALENNENKQELFQDNRIQ